VSGVLLGFVSLKYDTAESTMTMKIRGPIRINGDGDFTPLNGVVAGSGTPHNPYIIEGWEINATDGGACIYIGNTTAYFVIRNCRLYGTSEYWIVAGIHLQNVSNGMIYSIKTYPNCYGVIACDSRNVVITNCIYGGEEAGVVLVNCRDISVSRNKIIANASFSSISIHSCDNIILNDNIIFGKMIYSEYTKNCIVKNNALYSEYQGIYIMRCQDIMIRHNRITSSLEGILMHICRKCILEDNEINSGSITLIIDYGQDNTIRNNVLRGPSSVKNIEIVFSERIRIAGNTMEGGGIVFNIWRGF